MKHAITSSIFPFSANLSAVMAGCMCALAGVAHAQAPQTVATLDLQTVIVTGSRGEQRTVESSPAPVDVLSDATLEQTNKSNLLDVLNTLLPSFNLPLETGDLNSMVRAGQLRAVRDTAAWQWRVAG